MKSSLNVILVLLLCLIPTALLGKDFGNIHNVSFVGNHDGDTLTVNITDVPPIIGDHINVRVYGIDTPEIRGKCEKEIDLANKAKEYTYNILAEAKFINLLEIKRDKYFRILAVVETDKGSLAELLKNNSLAVEYFGGTKNKNWCE